MTITRYPKYGEKPITSERMRQAIKETSGNFFVSGFACSDGGGLNLSVAAGVAYIGYRITSTATETVALPDDSTRYVYLQDDKTFNLYATEQNNDDEAYLCKVVTASGSISTIDDKREFLSSVHTPRLFLRENDLYLVNAVQDKDVFFQVNDGGTIKTVLFFDASEAKIYADSLSFDIANKDILLERIAANQLGLATGDSFALDAIYLDRANKDVKIYRTDANVMAIDDRLRILSDTGLYVGAGDDLQVTVSGDNVYVKNVTQDKDIYFNINDGGVDKTVLSIIGATARVGVGTPAPYGSLSVAGICPGNPTLAGVHMGMSGNFSIIEMAGSAGGIIDMSDASGEDFSGRFQYDETTEAFWWFTNGAIKLYLSTGGHLYPQVNKGQDLGQAGNRWNNLYWASGAAGTSRLTESLKQCPEHKIPCVKGTGGLTLLGDIADYQLVWCPQCFNVQVEEVNYIDLDDGDIPDPDSMKIERLEYKQYSARSYGLEVHFLYNEKEVEVETQVEDPKTKNLITKKVMKLVGEENATVLGTKELIDFEALDEAGRTQMLQQLALKEWKSHYRQKRMEDKVEQKNREINAEKYANMILA